MSRKLLFVFFGFVLLAGCTPAQPESSEKDDQQTYLFLGHTYDWLYEDRIDPRLEVIDYSQFSGVWLGGDICARTTKSEHTLAYLDSIFDLRSVNTLWTWGNHDLLEGDATLLEEATGRPGYYTHYDNGLLVVVLNTNLFWHHPWAPPAEQCAEKAAHYAWLNAVLDTVAVASHVVLLHHHGLLNELKVRGGDTLALGNVDAIPVRPLCDSVRSFTTELYPKLVVLQEAGREVILISGDVGMKSKGYHFTTPEGILLLGSGINNSLDMNYPPEYVTNFNPDSLLQLQYQPSQRTFSWSFISLSDFFQASDPSHNARLQHLISSF